MDKNLTQTQERKLFRELTLGKDQTIQWFFFLEKFAEMPDARQVTAMKKMSLNAFTTLQYNISQALESRKDEINKFNEKQDNINALIELMAEQNISIDDLTRKPKSISLNRIKWEDKENIIYDDSISESISVFKNKKPKKSASNCKKSISDYNKKSPLRLSIPMKKFYDELSSKMDDKGNVKVGREYFLSIYDDKTLSNHLTRIKDKGLVTGTFSDKNLIVLPLPEEVVVLPPRRKKSEKNSFNNAVLSSHKINTESVSVQ